MQHAEDDDWGQPERWSGRCWTTRPAAVGGQHLRAPVERGVRPVLLRAFQYWRNVDKDLGDRIEITVRAKEDEKDPKAEKQANPARRSMQAKA